MGIPGAAPTLLGGFDSNISLLELGKQHSARGIGLSARARSSTANYLSQSINGLNIILSAGVEASILNTQTQILAIQARLPASSIGSFAARFDNNEVPEPSSDGPNGQIIDTTA